MRITTNTTTVPSNRPVRKQPATVQPHFGPGPEMVGLSNPALTAKPSTKPAKKQPKATQPAPQPQVPGFGQEYRPGGPGQKPVFIITNGPAPTAPVKPGFGQEYRPGGPGQKPVFIITNGPTNFTPNPNAPKAPLQVAPSAGRGMPAAWKLAGTLVSEG